MAEPEPVEYMDDFQLDPTFLPLYEGPHLTIGAVSGSTSSQIHNHSGLQVSVFSGQGSLKVEWLTGTARKRQVRLAGPSICITPAEQLHAMQWSDTTGSLLFGIEPELMGDTRLDCIQEAYGLYDPLIAYLAALLGDVHRSESALSRVYAEATVVILIQQLRRLSGKAQTESSLRSPVLPSRQLGRVLEYINENLNEDLSLVTLADIAGMSVSHFARSFKSTLGITPHCYLLQGRVARAKSLLEAAHLTIAEIALECGFVSQSHFTTVFRKIVGATPKIYGRSLRNEPLLRKQQNQEEIQSKSERPTAADDLN